MESTGRGAPSGRRTVRRLRRRIRRVRRKAWERREQRYYRRHSAEVGASLRHSHLRQLNAPRHSASHQRHEPSAPCPSPAGHRVRTKARALAYGRGGRPGRRRRRRGRLSPHRNTSRRSHRDRRTRRRVHAARQPGRPAHVAGGGDHGRPPGTGMAAGAGRTHSGGGARRLPRGAYTALGRDDRRRTGHPGHPALARTLFPRLQRRGGGHPRRPGRGIGVAAVVPAHQTAGRRDGRGGGGGGGAVLAHPYRGHLAGAHRGAARGGGCPQRPVRRRQRQHLDNRRRPGYSGSGHERRGSGHRQLGHGRRSGRARRGPARAFPRRGVPRRVNGDDGRSARSLGHQSPPRVPTGPDRSGPVGGPGHPDADPRPPTARHRHTTRRRRFPLARRSSPGPCRLLSPPGGPGHPQRRPWGAGHQGGAGDARGRRHPALPDRLHDSVGEPRL